MAIKNPFKNVMPSIVSGAKNAVSKLPSLVPIKSNQGAVTALKSLQPTKTAQYVESLRPSSQANGTNMSPAPNMSTLPQSTSAPNMSPVSAGRTPLPANGPGIPVSQSVVSDPTRMSSVSSQQAPSNLTGAERQRYIENQAFGLPAPAGPPVPSITSLQPPPTTTPQPDFTAAIASSPQTSPLDPLKGTISDARQRLLALMSPSERERALQDELTSFQESARLGIAGLSGQGRGIPLNLVQGQQAKLGEQAGIQEQTMLQRLATEVANRQAQATALGTELTFAEKDLERALAEEAKKSPGQPFEFDGNLVQYNPATGQVETLAQGTPEAAKPITVSPGQTIIDPNTGQILFQAAEKAETLPTSIQEYLFATQQGYTGGFLDYQASSGAGEKTTAVERKASSFLNRAEAAEIALQNALDSGVSNIWLQQRLPRQLQGEDYKLFVQAGEDFIKAVLRQESGAAIPEEEMKSYFETFFPQPGDTDAVIQQKAASRQQMMEGLAIEAGNAYSQPGGTTDIDSWLDSFNSDLSMSQNGFGNFNNTQNLPPVQKTVSNLFGQGIITGYGSKLWDPGLDYVLPGGKNAQVKLPVPTTVVAVRPANQTGGFGNQVQLRMPDGKTIWVSHLDKMLNVQPGTVLPANTTFGTQGNTGNTYGRTGIHLDLTMPKQGGGYYTAEQVASYLNTIG